MCTSQSVIRPLNVYKRVIREEGANQLTLVRRRESGGENLRNSFLPSATKNVYSKHLCLSSLVHSLFLIKVNRFNPSIHRVRGH